jgi:hypothetical protein
MHAVCGYPVKSTWLRAIKAGNFVGWPMLTERNVSKYCPDMDESSIDRAPNDTIPEIKNKTNCSCKLSIFHKKKIKMNDEKIDRFNKSSSNSLRNKLSSQKLISSNSSCIVGFKDQTQNSNLSKRTNVDSMTSSKQQPLFPLQHQKRTGPNLLSFLILSSHGISITLSTKWVSM